MGGSRTKPYLPREHGSWGMFFVPMLLGFLVGGFGGWPGALFIASATGLFLLREPFLAWWRLRRRGQPVPAGVHVAVAAYLALAVVPGAALIAYRPLVALLGALAGVGLAVNAELVMLGKGRTVATEVAAIVGSVFTAPAAYYVGTGAWDGVAWRLWALAALYFVSSVFYVKLRVQAAHARPGASVASVRGLCAAYHGLLLLLLLAAVITGWLPALVLAGFAAVFARAFWAVAALPRALNLKRIGWTEVLFSGIFLVCTATAL